MANFQYLPREAREREPDQTVDNTEGMYGLKGCTWMIRRTEVTLLAGAAVLAVASADTGIGQVVANDRVATRIGETGPAR